MLKCLNSLKVSKSLSASSSAVENFEPSLTLPQLRHYLVGYIKKIFEQYDTNKQEGNARKCEHIKWPNQSTLSGI